MKAINQCVQMYQQDKASFMREAEAIVPDVANRLEGSFNFFQATTTL